MIRSVKIIQRSTRIASLHGISELKNMSILQLNNTFKETVKHVNSWQSILEKVDDSQTQISPSWENKYISKYTIESASDVIRVVLSEMDKNAALNEELKKLANEPHSLDTIHQKWRSAWQILWTHVGAKINGLEVENPKSTQAFKRSLGVLVREHPDDKEYAQLRRQIPSVLCEKVFGYKTETFNLKEVECLTYFGNSFLNWSKYVDISEHQGLDEKTLQINVIAPAMHTCQLVSLKTHDEEEKTDLCNTNGWLNFALQVEDLYWQTL